MKVGINRLEGRKHKTIDFSTDFQYVSLYIMGFNSSSQHCSLFYFYSLLSRNPKAHTELAKFP
jgi:hypothetical protein